MQFLLTGDSLRVRSEVVDLPLLVLDAAQQYSPRVLPTTVCVVELLATNMEHLMPLRQLLGLL